MSPFSRRRFLQYAAGGTAAALGGSLLERVPPALAAGPGNPIVDENLLAGTGAFQLTASGFASGVTGFAARTCIDRGETLAVKIVSFLTGVNATGHIDVYRLGYYGGEGARLVHTVSSLTFTTQSAAQSDPQFGLRSDSAWTTTATIPGSATGISGVYVIKIVTDGGKENHIPFIVRDDRRARDLLVVMPTNTWQAYNSWPGGGGDAKSLYTSNSDPGSGTVPTTATVRASKVSFDRPWVNVGSYYDWVLHTEFPLIFWLEKNGYDIVYSDDTRMHGDPSQLLPANTKTLVLAGHSEYWTSEMRTNVEAARDAGTNIVSFSANTAYWQVRYENFASPDNPRTMVCFKTIEGTGASPPTNPPANGAMGTNDFGPGNNAQGQTNSALGSDRTRGGGDDHPELATTTFRDPGVNAGDPGAPNDDAKGHGRVGPGRPESQLLGVLYIGDDDSDSYPLQIPAASSGSGELTYHPIWRFTSVYGAGSAQEIDQPLVGWEWDAIPGSSFPYATAAAVQPAGVKRVAQTDINLLKQGGNLLSYLQDYGRARLSTPPAGQSANVHAVTYRAGSGALVFASGTMQWSLGLAPHLRRLNKLSGVNVWRYDVNGTYTTAYPLQDHTDFRIRQATCNLLFDTGVTPDTPENDLTVGPLPNPPPEPQPEPQPQPQPQPPPQPKISPRVNIKSRIVSVGRDGKLLVKVSAPSDQNSLGATMALTTASRVKETARAKASIKALGARGFSLKPGKTANLDFRLNRRMRKLLDRYRRLAVNAVVTSRDSDGTKGVSRGVVTLVAPPRPRRR
jgi:hypothetical protein